MRKTHQRVTPHTHLNQESSPQPLGVRRALQPIEPQRPGQTSEELLSIRYRSCPLSSVTEVILHKDKRAWPLANTGNTEKAGNAVSQSAATLSAGQTTGSPPAFLQCRGLAQPRGPGAASGARVDKTWRDPSIRPLPTLLSISSFTLQWFELGLSGHKMVSALKVLLQFLRLLFVLSSFYICGLSTKPISEAGVFHVPSFN